MVLITIQLMQDFIILIATIMVSTTMDTVVMVSTTMDTMVMAIVLITIHIVRQMLMEATTHLLRRVTATTLLLADHVQRITARAIRLPAIQEVFVQVQQVMVIQAIVRA